MMYSGAASLPGTMDDVDFSSISDLLNDKTFNQLGELIVKNPSFSGLVEPIKKTLNGDVHHFDETQDQLTMIEVTKTDDFIRMSQSLRTILRKDPSLASRVSAFLQNPSPKYVIDELGKGNGVPLFRFFNNKEVIEKLYLAGGSAGNDEEKCGELANQQSPSQIDSIPIPKKLRCLKMVIPRGFDLEKSTNKTQYIGVRRTSKGLFWAILRDRKRNGGELISLGDYATAEIAAFVHDEEAFKLRGSRAKLNFPYHVAPAV